MNGMDCLHVLIGSNRIPDESLQAALVVDAQAERLELLRQQTTQRVADINVRWEQAVLAANSNAEVSWFRFNDTRLDGIVPLEQWRSFFPNLQLAGQETLAATTLADLLDTWPLAHDPQHTIDLTISQGDPLQILEGAGSWIHRIQKIRLESPRAAELWEERCDNWLTRKGFRPDPQKALGWIIDPYTAKLIQQSEDANNRYIQYEQEIKNRERNIAMLLQALRHVFPYATYRRLRPDLAAFTDPQIVDHFVNHGINEGVTLQFSVVEDELNRLEAERSAEIERLELLNKKSRHTAQQLDLLKDLLARLMVNP